MKIHISGYELNKDNITSVVILNMIEDLGNIEDIHIDPPHGITDQSIKRYSEFTFGKLVNTVDMSDLTLADFLDDQVYIGYLALYIFKTLDGRKLYDSLDPYSNIKFMLDNITNPPEIYLKDKLSERDWNLRGLSGDLFSIYQGKIDLTNPTAIRIYLAFKGYDTKSISEYKYQDMIKILKLLNIPINPDPKDIDIENSDTVSDLIFFNFDKMSDSELSELSELFSKLGDRINTIDVFTNNNPTTLLIAASIWRDIRLMKLLLEAGADPNIHYDDQVSATGALVDGYYSKPGDINTIRQGLQLLKSYGAIGNYDIDLANVEDAGYYGYNPDPKVGEYMQQVREIYTDLGWG